MAHKRKQIRDAIVTRLTGLPTTGANVIKGAIKPLSGAQAPPALTVSTFPDVPAYEEDEGGEIGVDPRPARVLTVEIEGYYQGGDDDDLDQIAVEVEEALYTDPTFGGLVSYMELGEQDVGRDANGERVDGMIRLIFQCTYFAVEGSPQG